MESVDEAVIVAVPVTRSVRAGQFWGLVGYTVSRLVERADHAQSRRPTGSPHRR